MTVTRDALWRGKLVLAQPGRGEGYRFNLDAVLLAGFASPAERVLDLGAGVGVVGLLLLASGKATHVTAVEVQPELAALALANARDNGFADRLEVRAVDLRALDPLRADAVVFNPPYFRATEGRGSPDPGRDAARHERHGTLEDFVACALGALTSGTVAAIVPARRCAELTGLLRARHAVSLRRREVRPRSRAQVTHWLLEARYEERGSGATRIFEEPPLLIHEEDGPGFAPEVRELLER